MTEEGEQLTVKGEFEYAVYELDSMPVTLDAGLKMLFVTQGCLCLEPVLGFDLQVSLKSRQHNLFHLNSDYILSNPNPEETAMLICISLNMDFITRYLPEDLDAFQQFFIKSGFPRRFSAINLHLNPEINAVLHAIENSDHKGFGGDLYIESKVVELLALQWSLADSYLKKGINAVLHSAERAKMENAREILLSQGESQYSLRTLAHMVGTNEYNLKKNFKLVFGTTVYGYLNQHKMEEARSILLKGGTNVAEVAQKMGYKHATHFSSAFKKYFGYLPARLKFLWIFFDPEFLLILL
ncbi:helix-turn-helix transcriptional regulator [Pedobacter antarcticus]|uniref:helix-turn-helix transcriptional regulator n=1 Tax=Pedobacter antarcticus TaxID=34086 RepID=UPI00088DA17E|nr:AraC family transcriptional regulator [Pedobacter antarcticus]SDM35743.1 AraC-type DNA-binding protein [Pedobacter antarcticus]